MVATNDRSLSIQNGYGLEPYLTDFTSKMIIENDILPFFKQGSYAKGLDVGTNSIIEVLAGSYEGNGGRSIKNSRRGRSIGKLILFIVMIIIYMSRRGGNGGGGNGGGRYSSGMGPLLWGMGMGHTMGEVALAAEAQEVLEAEVLEASAADLSAEVVHPDPGSTLET